MTRNKKRMAIIAVGLASCVCACVFCDIWYYWLDWLHSMENVDLFVIGIDG